MNQEKKAVDELSIEEKAKELRRVAAKEYYQKNRHEIRKKRRLKRQGNLEAELKKEREYRAKNPEKIKQWNENYWKRKASKALNQEA